MTIYPWVETLSYITWAIRASYHHTIGDTPCQAVFIRVIIFNLASVVDWKIITAKEQLQFNIDHVHENAKTKQVIHDYTVGDIMYVDMTDICRKLYYKKYGVCIITEVFKNVIVRFQKVKVRV